MAEFLMMSDLKISTQTKIAIQIISVINMEKFRVCSENVRNKRKYLNAAIYPYNHWALHAHMYVCVYIKNNGNFSWVQYLEHNYPTTSQR